VAASVRRAADALAEAGYKVQEVDPRPIAAAFETWSQLIWTQLDMLWPLMEALVSPGARTVRELCFARWPALALDQLDLAWTERLKVTRAWTEFQVDYPLILGPVSTQPPFEVGLDIRGPNEAADHAPSSSPRCRQPRRFAISCAAYRRNGRGATRRQLIGPYLGDELWLGAAMAIEQRLGTFTPIDPVTGSGP
jgi:amidase